MHLLLFSPFSFPPPPSLLASVLIFWTFLFTGHYHVCERSSLVWGTRLSTQTVQLDAASGNSVTTHEVLYISRFTALLDKPQSSLLFIVFGSFTRFDLYAIFLISEISHNAFFGCSVPFFSFFF